MNGENPDRIDEAAIPQMDDDELKRNYEKLGAESEPHELDCLCTTCTLFLAFGNEIYQRSQKALKTK